ncbi:MAG: glycosyltransferase family 2 protein [Nanoarchaeota archaeon]|nr:glycosyltransferase family 2 protein [Nanoarchaeota archaeon]
MEESTYIVIPAQNESTTIREVVTKAQKYGTVVVVDDGSNDNTAKAAGSNVTVLTHLTNLGKGAALKTGCDYAIEQGASKIVVIDADTQHNPQDIPRFLETLKNCDVVLGYRKQSKSMPSILRFGNGVINTMTKILYGIDIRDTQCGFRAFTVATYKKIRWDATNYSMESEMVANIGRHKLSFAEVPIETVYADRYKGTTILDGIKIVLNLMWWRIKR